jgi:maleate isomerase
MKLMTKEIYGYDTRIGAIIPSLNTVVEPEFNALVPDGISVHIARLPLNLDTVVESLKQMSEGTETAARLLADARVSIISYVCTTGSLIKGAGWDRELIDRIEKATGVKATTTSTAVIKAFENLGVKQVVIASPYIDEVNQIEKRFLESHGIEVLQIKSFGGDLISATPEITYRFAHEVNMPEADAVFITCAGFKSITIIDRLEKELHKPVFSSNTATMWDILMTLDYHKPIQGYGRLLEL